jgi:Mg/Co/Ni transporter MgtE
MVSFVVETALMSLKSPQSAEILPHLAADDRVDFVQALPSDVRQTLLEQLD